MATQQKCRRTVCTNNHDNFVHSQTGDMYCKECAAKINKVNPEVPNLIRRHFQCERCGGMGQQEAGSYDSNSRAYNSPAGVCQLCNGRGVLGAMPIQLLTTTGKGG